MQAQPVCLVDFAQSQQSDNHDNLQVCVVLQCRLMSINIPVLGHRKEFNQTLSLMRVWPERLLLCMLYGLVRWVSFFLASVLYTHMVYLHCVGTAGDVLLELLDQAQACHVTLTVFP